MSITKKIIIIMASLIVIATICGNFLPRLFSEENPYPYLSIVTEVLHLIDKNYVEKVEIDKIAHPAYIDMVKQLGGESSFLDAEDIAYYYDPMKRGNADVGIILSSRENYLHIAGIIPGSPAEKAGVKIGSYIYSIDDTTFLRLSLYKAHELLKGQPRTKVNIKVISQQGKKPEQYIIERALINPVDNTSKSINESMAYIHLYDLNEASLKKFSDEIKGLSDSKKPALVIDLRKCNSKNYNLFIQAADLLFDDGVISSLDKKKKILKTYNAHKEDTLFNNDLYLIIDKTTLKACEVFASALVDNKRAISIGAETYGVAAEQEFIKIDDDLGLLLDSARYLRPTGNSIQPDGINPDHVYEGEGFDRARGVIESDSIINEIIELSNKKLPKAA
jgi:carboxyl-terminal processing protease